MNTKRRRWVKRLLKRILCTKILCSNDAKRWLADKVVFDKVYEKYLKGRLLSRPTWGAEPRWGRGFTYRKRFSV